jgi:nucleotide-binding universal stress UspA family protein
VIRRHGGGHGSATADELANLADTVAADLVVVVGASRHPANPVIASVGRRLSRHIAWPLTIVP